MRLINVETMKLEEYFDSQIPKYAILSHCWGTEEVTFQDFASPDWRRKRGAAKIERSSCICREHSLKYIWIDTCCIDKSSSAELSEAINSMYKWYARSNVCFAYLEDVQYSKGSESMRESRWFTRGWTMQELIAPSRIKFYDQQWMLIGKKRDVSALLSEITAIPEDVLVEPSELRLCSVARKMSWAADRQTTREEDIAYCLLGIFDVNMPLLYGEGERAFTRLQEEILKETDDQSLFAWGMGPRNRSQFYSHELSVWGSRAGVLALHPVDFAMSKDIVPFPSKAGRQPYSMTNKGLHIELALSRPNHTYAGNWIALLNCHYEDDFTSVIGIPLIDTGSSSEFLRSDDRYSRNYSIEFMMKGTEVRTIFISKRAMARTKIFRKCLLRVDSTEANEYTMEQIDGKNAKLNPEAMVLTMAFEIEDLAWGYASSTIMFTDGGHRNSSFAIVAILQKVSPLFPGSQEKIVDILPKPRDVTLEEWEKALKGREIDVNGVGKEVQLNVLPDDGGVDRSLTIKASFEEEDILNQRIDVLTVEISRDVPSWWSRA